MSDHYGKCFGCDCMELINTSQLCGECRSNIKVVNDNKKLRTKISKLKEANAVLMECVETMRLLAIDKKNEVLIKYFDEALAVQKANEIMEREDGEL